jgi:hypothetical protein
MLGLREATRSRSGEVGMDLIVARPCAAGARCRVGEVADT